jgi:hypothetical protein
LTRYSERTWRCAQRKALQRAAKEKGNEASRWSAEPRQPPCAVTWVRYDTSVRRSCCLLPKTCLFTPSSQRRFAGPPMAHVSSQSTVGRPHFPVRKYIQRRRSFRRLDLCLAAMKPASAASSTSRRQQTRRLWAFEFLQFAESTSGPSQTSIFLAPGSP